MTGSNALWRAHPNAKWFDTFLILEAASFACAALIALDGNGEWNAIWPMIVLGLLFQWAAVRVWRSCHGPILVWRGVIRFTQAEDGSITGFETESEDVPA